MNEEVKINKQANSITFTNNNISFSQFGIAKEILELIENQQSEIERLNNDIKVLLKENENKEKVIKAQDNIIKEVREYIEKAKNKGIVLWSKDLKKLLEVLDKEKK